VAEGREGEKKEELSLLFLKKGEGACQRSSKSKKKRDGRRGR